MCLLFADRGVERGDHTDDTDFSRAFGLRDVHEGQVVLRDLHIAERVANFDSVTGERQRVALKEDLVAFPRNSSSSCHRHILVGKASAG
jgi:hypothetical protein